MKKLKLKLDGKEMLTKNQMKQINGGIGYCLFWESSINTAHEHPVGGTTCEQTQFAANLHCINHMEDDGWSSCHYDCDCDG